MQTVFDDDLFAFFFSTVLLKVSFNMFNWEMEFILFSSAEVNKRQAAREAVAKVTTTTMLRFSKKKKKKNRDNLVLDFKVQLVTSYRRS